ncbi:MAG: amino acid adenylation domain-containing protein [Tatlockia sp.]|nr:amino acid adenylation domain-containing protein [Tatlockia sp.]
MNQSELEQLAWLSKWNKSAQDYPNDNLIQLFEKKVDEFPEKVACLFQNTPITYRELNQKANQLAHFILKQDLTADSPIAVYFERSIELVTTFLAVMKLGRPYIPIDKEASSLQLKTILDDARVGLILTRGEEAKKRVAATFSTEFQILDINQNNTEIEQEIRTNLAPFPATTLAYILYTSGTTGKPKGVQISHQSIVNLLFAMAKEIDISEKDVLLGITPLTFDLSVPDLYLPLVTGGSLILGSLMARFNPHEIIRYIDQYHVTLMQATPTTWQMLVNSGWKNESNIKIITGGEALTNQLASKLTLLSNNVWNFYGPTETTVWATCHKIETIDKSKPYIPIGKPMPNTQVYILDDNLVPLCVDMPGELYIGGDGVSPGYVNNSELTQRFFLDNPFLAPPGQKLYKTGDLAKWTPQGELYYLGRVDTQIKLRGYRIEVEAIENVLLNYPGIHQCIVHDETPDNTQELVAYVTLKTKTISASKVAEYLKNHFPDYMIPTKYIVVNQFPLTFNGKINRKAIPSITEYTNLANEIVSSPVQNPIEDLIVDLIKTLLNKDLINPESNFFNLGLHSLLLVELADKLNQTMNQPISVVDLFTYPTVRSLAQFLTQFNAISHENSHLSLEKNPENAIAVIGMSCKLPGANNPNDFWQTIVNKTEAIRFFNEEELHQAGISFKLRSDPDYVPARGILGDIDQFDASFFEYTPAEARVMDPQHRVFLEQAWTALEDASYVADHFSGSIGVFAGMSDSTYLTQNILKNPSYSDYDQQQLMLATSSHYLCTKVAYAMGLRGPAITVNTACSTSLVAIAMACDSLKNNQCDMALAGGITITVPELSGYLYKELGILSPNGHCNVFDKESKGTVMSNGCGIVVLKRLSDALKENDNILAVIKGWAVNNDGALKAGFTAPSVIGQVACIKEAVSKAQINTQDIGYIEAHGTGTYLGDPIEIAALSKGYGYDINKKNSPCALGSVKANIGHSDVASGAAGFIKLVMALQKKTLPPQIHFSSLNEKIHLEQSPFYINCEIKRWESKSKRLGAVHSLGFGGTNAHMILEEAPTVKTTESKSSNVFLISAKTSLSLSAIKTKLQDYLATHLTHADREKTLADMAYTLQVGRKHFKHRMAVAYSGYDCLLKALSDPVNKPLINNSEKKSNGRIIFGFSGQGTQYANMASELYQNQPLFKHIVDECCEKIQNELQLDLRDLLFPKPEQIEIANQTLCKTLYAQPALFIIEYALAQLLMQLGIKPHAMIGHSLGEFVAATLSGVFSLEASLKIITARARLMAKTKPGAMLVVPLSRETLSSLLPSHLDFAAHNAPNLCVVSGPKEDLIEFEKLLSPLLEKEETTVKYLHLSHAFHSAAMDEVAKEFAEVISELSLNPPTIPYISNVSGRWIKEEDLNSPQYWANHLRQPVLFSEGVMNLELSSEDVFIEIGPGSTLIQLVKQHLHISLTPPLIPTIPPLSHCEKNSYQYFLNAIGTLWSLKNEIHWEPLYANEIRKRISLPTYAFERQSHWITPAQNTSTGENSSDPKGLYTPSWKKDRTYILNKSIEKSPKTWLIFSNSTDSCIEKRIREAGHFIYTIQAGDYFEQLTHDSFVINPSQKSHYEKLFESVELRGKECVILHSWLFDNNALNEDTDAILQNGPYSILHLSQLLAEIHPPIQVNCLVLTCNLYSVLGDEPIIPQKASVLGPCKVIPLEQDTLFCKVVDLSHNEKITPTLANFIVHEALCMNRDCANKEIAYRRGHRWLRILEPCTQYIESNTIERVKTKGVYLITGGLGGIGLSLGHYLAGQYQANIILVSQTAIIHEREWEECISQNDSNNKKTIQKLKRLKSIKRDAESLTIEQASIENESQMRLVINSVLQRFGRIDGVIHAAGVAGGGVAQFKTIEEYSRVLQPKLQGTQTLLNLLHDEPMDFIVFISSVTSILGYPGQTDYCSANRILDAFASASVFKHSVFCVAMNWQAWRDVGMAADSETKLFQLDETNSNTPAEGVALFEKILSSDLNQVIISNSDPNTIQLRKELILNRPNEFPQSLENGFENDSVTPLVLAIWRNVLGLTNIQLDDDFYELGGHSLLAITLLAKLKTQFNIKIPASILFKAKTVRTLSKEIQSYTQQENSPLVILREGSTNKMPLFFVHPIGGTVFCYLALVEMLKNDRTYYGLQDPSLELEKPLFHTIEDMATFYRKAIQKIQPKGPYYLCGASFGATVAIEIAHQLLELNEKIHFLGFIDGWASFSNAQLDVDYIETLNIHHQENPDETILQGLENPKLWKTMLQHRLNLMSSYSIKKVDIPLSLFKAQEILSEYKEIDVEDNYWSSYSPSINCHLVPGDHNSMLKKPNVGILAEQMQKHLDS